MTDDRLAKVRAEIERRYKYNKEHENDWAGTSHYWQRKEDEEILSFIDSMQSEPKFKVGDQIFFKQCKTNTLKIISIGGSGYHCEDGTFLHFDNQDHWELVEEPTSFDEAIQEGDDVRYNEDLGCRVNLSQLKRVAKKEKSIDKDFEAALAKEWKGYVDRGAATVDALEDNTQELAFAKGFYRGSEWRKEQLEKNRLKHCDSITNEQAELESNFIDQHLDKYQRMPTFLDAIEYGMNLQKEQLMAKAVDATVHIDAGGYPYIPQMELYDYEKDIPLAKEGDKYKVIIIKE